MSRTLLAIDFANFAHRALHVYSKPDLRAPDGRPTAVVFGVLSMALGLIRELEPTHVAACFESRGPTERRLSSADYKAGREQLEPEIYEQFDDANRAIGRMGWARYRIEGHEADDALASLARQAIEAGFERVWIATGDKDLMGAVAKRVSVVSMGGGIAKLAESIYTPARVEERFGVRPEQIADWKALVGDAGDNYPGVPGIGPAKAPALIRQFGSFEALYARLDEVEPASLREKLRTGEAEGRRSLSLARLRADLPLEPPFDPAAGELATCDRARAEEFLRARGLLSLVRRLPRAA
jgi:DNA polymerase I